MKWDLIGAESALRCSAVVWWLSRCGRTEVARHGWARQDAELRGGASSARERQRLLPAAMAMYARRRREGGGGAVILHVRRRHRRRWLLVEKTPSRLIWILRGHYSSEMMK